jgi:peroxiredoxin
VKAFESALGANRRQSVIRVVLGLALVGVLVWALPERRAGESGGHHGEHRDPPGAHTPVPTRAPAPAPVVVDRFERAGVTELTAGQRGPTFRLATLDGQTQGLDGWHDKLVVLNFWATWCGPCTLEMPSLEALWARYRDRGLVVVGISVDRGAPKSLLDPYVAGLKLTFPILLDPNLETAGKWRVRALPTTFIVKPGGEVAGFAVSAREWNSAEMTGLLETMLPGHRRSAR